MKSRCLSASLVRKIRAHLASGGLIAYPTESCYGLGCDPRNYQAVRRLLQLKGRPQSKGLILVAWDFSQLKPFVAPLTQEQQARVQQSWPGPHTWLLPAAPGTPRWLTGRHPAIAVRVTAHPVAAQLCRMTNSALVSSSANRAGLRPAKTYAACVKAFGASVMVLPGRIGKSKKPSTIQDLLSGRIIRK